MYYAGSMREKKSNVNSDYFSVPFWYGFQDFLECLRRGVFSRYILYVVICFICLNCFHLCLYVFICFICVVHVYVFVNVLICCVSV